MESKIMLQFQEILYDRSWEKSKKLPLSKQTQAKTALFTSETKSGGVQKGRNKSGIPALQKRCIGFNQVPFIRSISSIGFDWVWSVLSDWSNQSNQIEVIESDDGMQSKPIEDLHFFPTLIDFDGLIVRSISLIEFGFNWVWSIRSTIEFDRHPRCRMMELNRNQLKIYIFFYFDWFRSSDRSVRLSSIGFDWVCSIRSTIEFDWHFLVSDDGTQSKPIEDFFPTLIDFDRPINQFHWVRLILIEFDRFDRLSKQR